jgi:transposase
LAVAHTVLVIAYHMLEQQEDYQELGADYFDRLNADAIRRSRVRRLERLGHRVILVPLPHPA